MPPDDHLLLEDIRIAPGGEWSGDAHGWRFLLVRDGVGYFLRPAQTQELAPGDVLVQPSGINGVVRASQLGEVRLGFFRVLPDHLNGLLTLSERHFLDSAAPTFGVKHFPAARPIAQDFLRATQQAQAPLSLAGRCRFLQLVATVLTESSDPKSGPARLSVTAKDRVRELLGRMSNAEFQSLSLDELARRCGCSPRHLNRLFHELFACSIGARQMELRLEKAKVLLQRTDGKVIHVALECGFKHLGLFSAVFKKRFGATPGKWRRELVTREKRKRIRRPVLHEFTDLARV